MRWLLAIATAAAVLLVATGSGVAQGGDPPWAGEVHAELERGAQTHNEWVTSEDPEFAGDRLAENEQAEVTVRDEAGAEAVYTVETDQEMRVTDVARGPTDDETMRVFASKPALEQALQSETPAAAVGDAIATGDIRVERVVGVAGHELAVGAMEGAVGLLGVGAGAALVGLLGAGTVLSLPGLLFSRGVPGLRATAKRLLNGLKTVLKLLAHLIAAVEALQLLGFEARERIRTRARAGRARARAAGASVRDWLAELDEMPEAEDRGRGGGEGTTHSEDGQ